MMLSGRKLAHLEGMRFDSLNRHQWQTYLTARADPGLGPSRRQRWTDAWAWIRGVQTYTWGKPFKEES